MLRSRHLSKGSRRRTVLYRLLIGLTAMYCSCLMLALWIDQPLPSGLEGIEADRLGRKIEISVHVDRWKETKAVRWTFAGMRRHLWDRKNQQVQFLSDDVEVLLALEDRSRSLAFANGLELQGNARNREVNAAYSQFVNDSFWLNPLAKLFDPGARRSLVHLKDQKALLVTYPEGGLTPGDSYLWILGRSGLPKACRMWVSVLPIGGLEVPWAGYRELSTGALVATQHRLGPLVLELSQVEAAHSLEALLGGEENPFDRLDTP
ncbi:MAG: hypothetical protein AAF355_14465 [Myxococcota bacterium]